MLQAARARIRAAQRNMDTVRVKALFFMEKSLLQSKSKGLYNKKPDKSRKRDGTFEKSRLQKSVLCDKLNN
jgi:hypothetical protein